MKYSPLAIHCTSLCFDVMQRSSFKTLTHRDIDEFKDDVYALICERAKLMPTKQQREHQFASHVADGVISVLHQCLNNPSARDSIWILAALESRIDTSIKTIIH
ncbi:MULTISPECIES: hypothetical protein [Vibrio]|uniref:Uncharacterized protein n=1 Tax=Vibrio genomosp. F6 str. FF-238 TaxID=1191298 RepID=A0A1E5D4F8_9VIBR|nr:hypothetical protein [Vibrio genomosp. F6]OEE78421.1 hypothetical protein A130_13125 [Vibrio genomosp. F6 str. FF-238]TKF18909.1 hypothetical protein FCV43_15500 [Vibrio genomosp. F6]